MAAECMARISAGSKWGSSACGQDGQRGVAAQDALDDRQLEAAEGGEAKRGTQGLREGALCQRFRRQQRRPWSRGWERCGGATSSGENLRGISILRLLRLCQIPVPCHHACGAARCRCTAGEGNDKQTFLTACVVTTACMVCI